MVVSSPSPVRSKERSRRNSPSEKKRRTDRDRRRSRSPKDSRKREKRRQSASVSPVRVTDHTPDDGSPVAANQSKSKDVEVKEEPRTPSRSPSPHRRRRQRSKSKSKSRSASPKRAAKEPKNETETVVTDLLNTRTGGAYIPPAKLRRMQEQMGDKTSEAYQRLEWERMKKKIHGLVNKANVGNLTNVVRDLFKENIVAGRGLLARSVIQAQSFSPTFSHVYAALVAVINSKFPSIGELIVRRLIIQFKRSFRRNDKATAATACKFIAHCVNQQLAHELIALEILTLLLEAPSDDSVEISVAFLKEAGAKLSEVTPRGMMAIYDRLREILSNSATDVRIQYMIEVAMAIRRDKFKAHPAMLPDLDLLEEEDVITHTISLEDAQDPENMLNIFKCDPDFAQNQEVYAEIRRELLGDSDEEDEDGEGEEEEDENDETATVPDSATLIIDRTEHNLVAFRRTVYLTLQSSLDYQEAIHKLFKMEIKPGWEPELCNMVIDCCAEKRTYEKFYGLLAERLCRLRKEYQAIFEQLFQDIYSTVHRFEHVKLRNVCRLNAHLLYTDAISWTVLSCIRLNEEDTSSSSRIYIKNMFLELVEFMGLDKLYSRVIDPTYQVAFDGLFPRDNPRDSRFAINFFTSIGQGGLTVELREHLAAKPKQSEVALPSGGKVEPEDSSSSSSSDSSSSDSDSSDDSDDDKKPPPPVKNRSPARVRGRDREVENERGRNRREDNGRGQDRQRDGDRQREDGRAHRDRQTDRHNERDRDDTRGRDNRTQRSPLRERRGRSRSPEARRDRRDDRDRRADGRGGEDDRRRDRARREEAEVKREPDSDQEQEAVSRRRKQKTR